MRKKLAEKEIILKALLRIAILLSLLSLGFYSLDHIISTILLSGLVLFNTILVLMDWRRGFEVIERRWLNGYYL